MVRFWRVSCSLCVTRAGDPLSADGSNFRNPPRVGAKRGVARVAPGHTDDGNLPARPGNQPTNLQGSGYVGYMPVTGLWASPGTYRQVSRTKVSAGRNQMFCTQYQHFRRWHSLKMKVGFSKKNPFGLAKGQNFLRVKLGHDHKSHFSSG